MEKKIIIKVIGKSGCGKSAIGQDIYQTLLALFKNTTFNDDEPLVAAEVQDYRIRSLIDSDLKIEIETVQSNNKI